jgi:hypothetical protein
MHARVCCSFPPYFVFLFSLSLTISLLQEIAI